jgi:hypothetical protein
VDRDEQPLFIRERRNYVLNPLNPVGLTLILIILVGVAVGLGIMFAEQRDRTELTEGEFRDAVHEAAEELSRDARLDELNDLSLVIGGAISDAEESAHPDVDAIGDDSWDFDTDPPAPPTYNAYEISADEVTAVFCMHVPSFNVTEGQC